MTFLEYQTEVAAGTGVRLGNAEALDVVKNAINFAISHLTTRAKSPFLEDMASIVLTPNYTTGTASATNGSRTITGSGTTWTSAMKGRFFSIGGDVWYEIISVDSGTQITLKLAYQGDTESDKKYKIWQRFYSLPSKVRMVYNVFRFGTDTPLTRRHWRYFTLQNRDNWSTGYPTEYTVFKQDIVGASYSTGTVSATLNSATLTGTGTTWLANVNEGELITIGSNKYNVKSIDSNTQITMWQKAVVAATDSAYTIERIKDAPVLMFNPSPDDEYVMEATIKLRHPPLRNDSDEPLIPDEWKEAVVQRACSVVARGYTQSPRGEAFQLMSIIEEGALMADSKEVPEFEQFAPVGVFGMEENAYG